MKIKIHKFSRYTVFILIITILLTILAIPSFAVDSSFSNTLPVYPSTSTPAHEYVQTNGMLLWTTSSGNHRIGMSSVDDMSAFIATENGTTYMFFIRYGDADRNRNIYHVNDGNDYATSTTTMQRLSSDSESDDYLLYLGSVNLSSGSIPNPAFPVFSSQADGIAAYKSYLEQSNVSPHKLSLSIPAGNALVVDISNLSTVEINASITTEVAHPSSWYTNQYYSIMSSYPSSIGNRPSNANTINWTGTGQTTLFNRYKSFYWNNTIASSAGYICITNPYASLDEYDQSFNPTINVTFSQAKGYKYYQLTGGISSDGNIGQQSDGTTASGTYDDSTGQWSTTNDETGLPWTPQEGGGNLITTNSINDWLKTIATQISNFFQGAIGAVTTLVNAGSSFIHTLISLYSWLPAPVYAVLSSALILVITIGVIKVFI